MRKANGRPDHGKVLDQTPSNAVDSERTLLSAANGTTATRLGDPNMVTLSSVQQKPLEWLWKDHIPLGKLTSISGDPGLGKSLVLLDHAARVSIGAPWPDGDGGGDPGDVILLAVEDDVADTICPRLAAAGADLSRIHLLQSVVTFDENTRKPGERAINLQRDIDALERALGRTKNPKFIGFDPISVYCGDVDSHKNTDVRMVLGPLAELAQRTGVAIVYISHLNKSAGSAMYRTSGSLAFVAAARAAWIVTKDKTDPMTRLVLPLKNNLAPDAAGMSYSIATVDNQPVVAWNEVPVMISADEALEPELRRPKGNLEHDKKWLSAQLADGPKDSEELTAQARAVGISRNRLFKAKDAVGASARKNGFAGQAKWEWFLDA